MEVLICSALVIYLIYIVSSESESPKKVPPKKPMSEREKAIKMAARPFVFEFIRQIFK